mmetsp:Transcript_10440/g.26513  ORF Transcript_10440/g.26513 Transcript_10440/m.26513 type:complete len:249 (-) Transcript_10440:200-946(-)
MRKCAVLSCLSLRDLMGGDEGPAGRTEAATLELAHRMISSSSTLVPSPLRDERRSTVLRRMSCHMTARMSFLLPAAMSVPPMLTRTRSMALPVATTWLPFSTRWCLFLGVWTTLRQGTEPAWMWSMTERMGRPLQSSRKRSLTWRTSPFWSRRLSELSQSLKVRASRVSPASSRSRSARPARSSSSRGGRPWRSLKSWAVKAKLSLALPETTSPGLMKGVMPTARALSRTWTARLSTGAPRSTTRPGP